MSESQRSPTSSARVAANRLNAARSTGPRTVAGKAVSRLNAFRHALAGEGDLVGPNEDLDLDLVEERTQAFTRELKAPGVVGRLLAHRASVLSLRLERASLREFVTVETAVRAARAEFDADRQVTLDGWIAALDGPEAPDQALEALGGLPEGVDYLLEAWQSLRSALVMGDPAAADRAVRWLGGIESDPAMGLLARVDAEVARLQDRAGSAAIAAAARLAAIERDEVGLVAGFDPSPEATRARRYEDATERGLFRTIRAIADLRSAQTPDSTPGAIISPPPATAAGLKTGPTATDAPTQPATPPTPPRPAPPIATPPRVSLGSFRVGITPPDLAASAACAALGAPPAFPPQPPKKRRDVRKPARGRR